MTKRKVITPNSATSEKMAKLNMIITNANIHNFALPDNSIIDVTGESYKITKNELQKNKLGVPYWKEKNIHSYSEFNQATTEQKIFYHLFKERFLRNEYLDLEENSNYAFLLLYDLLNEYDRHRSIVRLQNQLDDIGYFYPKTKAYTDLFLKRRKEEREMEITTNQTIFTNKKENVRVGDRYKTILNLNEEQVSLLNRPWFPNNKFNSNEFFHMEIAKLYLATMQGLHEIYKQEGTSLDEQFMNVAHVIAQKHFRGVQGNGNYTFFIQIATNEFYNKILIHCENAVRDFYGHRAKLDTDSFFIISPITKAEYEKVIISKVNTILPRLVSNIALPDEATEINLNHLNPSRWKIKFQEIKNSYKDNPKEFVDAILLLNKLNKKNPSVVDLFFEASKFMLTHNKETALTLYTYYVYHGLTSKGLANKQFSKTMQKILFQTKEQLQEFETITSELKKDRNLEKALSNISQLFTVKRKIIELDKTIIKQVKEQHVGTVELLNEYLKEEDETNSSKTQTLNKKANQTKKPSIAKSVEIAKYTSDISFTSIHIETMELFTKNNFSIAGKALIVFAKSKGLFPNQLIESLNEICYEVLDDVLIEEEENCYTMNETYFKRVLAK